MIIPSSTFHLRSRHSFPHRIFHFSFLTNLLIFVTYIFSLTFSFTSDHIGPNEADRGPTPLNRSREKRIQFHYCLFIFLPFFFFFNFLKHNLFTGLSRINGFDACTRPYLDSGCQIVSDHFRLPSHDMAVEICRAKDAHVLNGQLPSQGTSPSYPAALAKAP